MLPVASLGDAPQGEAGEQTTGDLGDPVGDQVLGREAPRDHRTDRDGGVEMTTGDVPDGVHHREDGEAERQRHAEVPDPDVEGADVRVAGDLLGGEDRRTTTAEDQPEGAEEFG
jgi:hypothetical protein